MDEPARQMIRIVNNIRKVLLVIKRQSQVVRMKTGLTGPQIWTIKTISDTEPLSVKELARRIYLHPATVVGIIDRLEEHGLVFRSQSHKDRRVVLVGLTPKGKKLVKKAPEAIQGTLINGMARLTARRRKIIYDGLAELVKMLGIETVPPQLILSRDVNLRGTETAKRRNGETRATMVKEIK